MAKRGALPCFRVSGHVRFLASEIVKWSIQSSEEKRSAQTAGIEAQRDEALITYQQTILNALEEVENEIVAYTRERERYQHLLTAVSASRRALELSTELYLGGLKNFLDVLDAQRSLLSSENGLAASQAAVSKDLVALVKALGGGWQSFQYDAKRSLSRSQNAG